MAKEVIPFAAVIIILILIFFFLHIKILLILSIVCLAFVLFFFRDPERIILYRDGSFLSAADGKIVEIKKEIIDNITYNKISVFMSIFNVHINRIPMDGVVSDIKYVKGIFPVAWKNDIKGEREHTLIKINIDNGAYYIKQVAGSIARRIVCKLKLGDNVKAGQRFGMIKFSSRVEHFIPSNFNVEAKVGDLVKGGVTTLAKLNENSVKSTISQEIPKEVKK